MPKSAPREAGGPEAANVLILRRVHFGIVGDQLSRQMVIEALGKAQPGERHLSNKAGALVARAGVLVSSALPAEPFAIMP